MNTQLKREEEKEASEGTNFYSHGLAFKKEQKGGKLPRFNKQGKKLPDATGGRKDGKEIKKEKRFAAVKLERGSRSQTRGRVGNF